MRSTPLARWLTDRHRQPPPAPLPTQARGFRGVTTPAQAIEALDSDLDAIAAAVARHLDDGAVALDDDGDPIGVTYRDSGTRCYYAADLDDCRALLERIAAGEVDAYSLWCKDSCAQEHATAKEAAGDL